MLRKLLLSANAGIQETYLKLLSLKSDHSVNACQDIEMSVGLDVLVGNLCVSTNDWSLLLFDRLLKRSRLE